MSSTVFSGWPRIMDTSERGNLVGKPSITKLLEAIADGSARLVKNFPTQTENIP